ncbi:MAG: hypothetical protein SWO11_12660 [Thermodesulfobacteriota bacterium]|nr:hypothetical protein [Thermodesulfobacteriota bacterium]
MSIDITKSIFRILPTEGVVYTPGFFNTLRAAYLRIAQDTILRYYGNGLINVEYYGHDEGTAVEMFSNAIHLAGEIISDNPLGPPQIPNWNRVFAAIPDFSEKLLKAVREDNP